MAAHVRDARSAGGALRVAKVVFVVALAVLVCLSLGGCKISDRLTETIYDQDSDDIDYDNPSKVLVQDPTAEATTDELPLIENEDEEKDDQEEEEPEQDEETNTDESAQAPDMSGNTGTSYSVTEGGTLVYGDGEGSGEGDGVGEGAGDEGDGGSEEGDGENETEGGSDEGEGRGDDAGGDEVGGSGGSRGGGSKTLYSSVGSSQKVPTGIDYVAACGEAATIVSMLAGDSDALRYTDSEWANRKNVKKVLGDRYNDDVQIAWSEDGDNYDLSSEALQAMIDDEKLECVFVTSGELTLTEKQQETLQDAGITISVLPDSTTATNIEEKVEWVGRIFEAGDKTNKKARNRADSYVDFHDEILEDAADIASTKTKDNDGAPVESSKTQYYTLYVSGWADDVTYTRNDDVTIAYGIGICTVGHLWSPLYYYMSVGGAYNTSNDYRGKTSSKTQTTLVNQFNTNHVGMYASAFNKSSFVDSFPISSGNTAYGWTYLDDISSGTGFGSEEFPYVITSNQADAEKMENDRELGEDNDDINTLYEMYPLVSNSGSSVRQHWIGFEGTKPNATVCYATGGTTEAQNDDLSISELSRMAKNADYDVVTNPEGLFGESWTDGSVESVLETAWISYLYYPDEHKDNYVSQTVYDFYSEFYGCELTSSQLSTILEGPEDD